MKNIAPEILRQRLIIEARYSIDVTEETVKDFLLKLPEHLKLRVYGDPIIHCADGKGRDDNYGYDAFIPLIDSGISLYVWTKHKFISCIIFTCKEFSDDEAVIFLKEYFNTTELEKERF